MTGVFGGDGRFARFVKVAPTDDVSTQLRGC